MALPIFAYIISFVVLTNPAAAAAVQSSAYADIFSATDVDEFVESMDRYLAENLAKNSSVTTNYLVQENESVLNNRALRDTFWIQEHYFNVVRAETIEFLITLGSSSPSIFQLEVSNSTFSEAMSVTVSNSAQWNVVNLQTPMYGSIDVNITGISTQSGDAMPTFTENDFNAFNGTSINSTSAYYHSYTYTTTTTTMERYWSGTGWIYYPVTHQVTHTGWKTELLQEVPAIRIENKDVLSYTYNVGGTYNGHYKILKHIYKNNVEISTLVEGYADYPSYIGYKVITQGVDPNFFLDGIPLDQLLMEFLQDEGLASTSFDVNTFLNDIFTLLQDPANTSTDFYTTVENEAYNFLSQMNGPYDDSHPTKYVIDKFQPASKNMTNQLGLFRETWGSTQQCIQWIWDYGNPDNPVKVCQQYRTAYLRQSTTTVGLLSLASSLGFPSSLQNVLLLKTDGMVTYPSEPYFFHWLAETTQTMTGIQYNQTLLDQIAASTPLDPRTNTQITSLKPYNVDVSVTDAQGQTVYGNVPITLKNSTGSIVGEGTAINGTVHITTPNYFENVTAKVEGNDFYMSSQTSASAVQMATSTVATLTRPYEVNVTIKDITGELAIGPMQVTVESLSGAQIGSGTITTGTGIIPISYAEEVTAYVSGNGYFTPSYDGARAVQLATTTNVSLVLDQNAPEGTNPYVADITVKDSDGNMALGSLPVTLTNSTGSVLATGTVVNGTGRFTLPDYEDQAIAYVGSSGYYLSSSGTGTVQYDLTGMIQTQGPAGSNAVENAKFTIIKDYIENSGAFDQDPTTGNYTWNGNDACDKWTDSIPLYGSVDRGYCTIASSEISQQELDSGQFDNGTFTVTRYSGAGVPPSQYTHDYTLSKMKFFELWIGQKLQPCSYGGNPPEPEEYTGLESLASDFSIFLSKDKNYFQTDSGAQDFSAKVQGLLKKATSLDFPDPKGVLDQLADFVNDVINAFFDAITAVWHAIVSFVGTVANFVITVWNNIIGPVMGAVTEIIKTITNTIINAAITFLNSLLNTYSTSGNNPMKGKISQYRSGSEVTEFFSNVSTKIDVQTISSNFSNQMNTVTSTIGSVNSLISKIDISKFIPSQVGILVEVAQLMNPATVTTIIGEVINDFVSKNLESNILSNLGLIFTSTSSVDNFKSPINNIKNFDYKQATDKITTISVNSDKTSSSPDLPPTYDGPTPTDYSPILSAYNFVFDNIRNLGLFIESNIPFQELVDPIIEGIGGFLYQLLFQWTGISDLNMFYEILSMAIIEILLNFIGPIADKIGGTSGDVANTPMFTILGTDSLSHGELELLFDGLALCLASLESKLSFDVDSRLISQGKNNLAEKLSYYGNSATIVGYNYLGEAFEDIGKMYSSKDSSNVDNNQKANARESLAELFRILATSYQLFYFSPQVFQNKLGFGLKISDVLFLFGWVAYFGQQTLNLIKYLYGLMINIKDFWNKIYSGIDQPLWMDTSDGKNPYIRKINYILLIGASAGGVFGYISSLNGL